MADNRSLRFGKKKAEPHACKKRKMVEKVVMVKLDTNGKRAKSEGPPPSDSWSWRKYGQKPIKGSPFPRGYYRCSTSKGCTAKKQVERCKTDASKMIVTYTSSHNHTITKITKDSGESSASVSEKLPETQELEEELEMEQKPIEKSDESTHINHPVSEIDVTQEGNPLVKKGDVAYDSLEVICKEQPLPDKPNRTIPSLIPLTGIGYMDTTSPYAEEQTLPNADENDIYDGLDELPIPSCLTELMRSNFFDERILVEPF